MGSIGIALKIPLTATGSTAPEANLEAACGAMSWGEPARVEIHWELSSTAEAAPPT
jgi:hypothetical protein